MKNWVQGVIDAMQGGSPKAATLYELQLADGTIYLTDAAHDIVHHQQTYTAAGQVLGRDDISSRKSLEVQSINLVFTLVEQGIWAVFGNTSQLNRRVIITEVILDDKNQPIGETLRTVNRVNGVSVDDNEDSATVTVNVSNIMADFEAVRGLRSTQASHQRFYPESTSFINSRGFNKDLEWRG